MNYIVFDLEWNQSPGGRYRENPKIPFEILEIGALKLNARRRIIGEFHETIKPLVYRAMNRHTQAVVHMDMEALRQSRTFSPVARSFLEWCGEDYIFVSWGPSDLFELQRNLDYYHIQYRFPKPLLYYDLQKLYSLENLDGKKRPALQEAVEAMGIAQTRRFHAAFDDAWYTAKIMQNMNFKSVQEYKSVDYYHLPESKEEEIYLDFKTYSKYVSMSYPDKETALKDKTVTAIGCNRCNLPVIPRIKWFAGSGGNMYYALVQCPRHGYVKGKIRIRKAQGDEIYIVKTIKPATEADVEDLQSRKAAVKERRHKKLEKEKERKKLKREKTAAATHTPVIGRRGIGRRKKNAQTGEEQAPQA